MSQSEEQMRAGGVPERLSGAAPLRGPGHSREAVRDLFPLAAKTLLFAATLVVALWFLHRVQQALLVLLVAVITSIVLNVPILWLERRGASRTLATLVVFTVLLAVSALLGWLIVPRIVRETPIFLGLLPSVVTELMEQIGVLLGNGPEVERQLATMTDWLVDTGRDLWRYASALVGAVLLGIVILALSLFILLDPHPLLSTYLRFFPERLREPATRAFVRSSRMVVGWVVAAVIVGAIRGTATYFFLLWMGVPGALLWAVLAFVTVLIPQVGFYLMAIPPVLLAAADSLATALWTALFFTVLSEFLGNFVVPRIQGGMMRLHPAYLLAVTVLMAFAFGLVGVLIAAPIAGIVQAYAQEFHFARDSGGPRADQRVRSMLTGGGEAGG